MLLNLLIPLMLRVVSLMYRLNSTAKRGMLSCSLVQKILLLHEGAKTLAVPEFLPHDFLPRITVIIKDNITRAREMGQQLRVHAVRQRIQVQIPAATSNSLTADCRSSSQDSDVGFWPLWAAALMCTDPHHTYT